MPALCRPVTNFARERSHLYWRCGQWCWAGRAATQGPAREARSKTGGWPRIRSAVRGFWPRPAAAPRNTAPDSAAHHQAGRIERQGKSVCYWRFAPQCCVWQSVRCPLRPCHQRRAPAALLAGRAQFHSVPCIRQLSQTQLACSAAKSTHRSLNCIQQAWSASLPRQRLTPRSRRGPTSKRQARAAGGRIFHRTGLAFCCRSRLSSNVRPHKETTVAHR